jgi:hypothetical protein
MEIGKEVSGAGCSPEEENNERSESLGFPHLSCHSRASSAVASAVGAAAAEVSAAEQAAVVALGPNRQIVTPLGEQKANIHIGLAQVEVESLGVVHLYKQEGPEFASSQEDSSCGYC